MLRDLKKLVGPKTDEELLIQRYKQILNERSDPSPELHLKIGRLYEKIGEKGAASDEYRQAAQLYLAREEYVGALVANKLLIRFDKNDADALANVAFIELQQGITLSPGEFEIFLRDLGQPLRFSTKGQESSDTKRSRSRLALSHDTRPRQSEKHDPNFQANRRQLLDLIAGDSEAEESFDASFDTDRHALIKAIKDDDGMESSREKEESSVSAPSGPSTESRDAPIGEMPFIDLTQNAAPGEQIPNHTPSQVTVSGETSDKIAEFGVGELPAHLERCSLFSDLSGEEHELLQQQAHMRKIIKETSQDRSLAEQQVLSVLLEGRVELMIYEGNADEQSSEKLFLLPGDFWGEHAFFKQADFSFSTKITRSGWIVEIPKTTISSLAQKHPSLLDRLKRSCKRRCFSHVLRQVELFRDLSMEELQNIAEHLFAKEMKKDSILIREGDEYDESIFLIQSGNVEVYTSFVEREELQVLKTDRDRIHLAYLQEGDFFGEGVHFTKEPRSATIVAQTDGRLLKLPTKHLKKLIHDYPRIESALLQFHEQRVKSTMETLQSALTF